MESSSSSPSSSVSAPSPSSSPKKPGGRRPKSSILLNLPPDERILITLKLYMEIPYVARMDRVATLLARSRGWTLMNRRQVFEEAISDWILRHEETFSSSKLMN